jgi:dTDP-4-dehydrorhamnose reductase
MSEPRIVVLGAGGMLGHKVFQAVHSAFPDAWATIHGPLSSYPVSAIGAFNLGRVIDRWEAVELERVDSTLRRLEPAFVVNCIGVIKQRSSSHDALLSITVNSLLPHKIARTLAEWGGRVIHISTDCVFSGSRGMYSESDLPDALDLYGRSKALGEVVGENSLTLRTSLIGRELRNHSSLLDWLRSHNHQTVPGFRKAWWSGVTTNYLADLIVSLIRTHPKLSGLFHVASQRISKFDTLQELRDAYQLDIKIVPDDGFILDRSLNGSRFEQVTGYHVPSWPDLLSQLVSDTTLYHNNPLTD